MGPWITKGMRVRARWQETDVVALAGETMKFQVSGGDVTGVVMHIRGDHPTQPTSIRLWILPDEGGEEIIVKPEWIVSVEALQ